jgi:hypothetical protein
MAPLLPILPVTIGSCGNCSELTPGGKQTLWSIPDKNTPSIGTA